MREAECARSNLAEDLSRLRMELEKVVSLSLFARLCMTTKNAVDCLALSAHRDRGHTHCHISSQHATCSRVLLKNEHVILLAAAASSLSASCRFQQSVTALNRPTLP